MLDPYRWKNRILVIFNGDELKKSQREILEHDIPGLHERDIIILGLGGEREPFRIVPDIELKQLRKAFALDEPSIALFGKDGSVKARWDGAASISDIFEIIDSMPMRKREMREKRR